MSDMENIHIELDDESDFQASLISDMQTSLTEGDRDQAPAPAPPTPDTAPEETQPDWIGKVLGHFKLLRLIGQGSMGFVVQARDMHLKRIVALKILRRRIKGLPDEKRVLQFLREAQAAARIEHPNVIHVYEIDQHEGWWYLAMEWLEGQDLRTVVYAAGPLPPSRACPVLADAAVALSVAHESGIIHRDVKPSNLMLTRTGRCKLTDFGFARLQDPGDPFDFTDLSVGTPQFMAPETIRGQAPTSAVDVYSLGATLHFALLGRAPYTGRAIRDICQQHLHAPPPDLREHLPTCPASLARLVQRAMAKDPGLRPSAVEMAAALHAEAVASRPDDSHLLAGGGSTVVARPVELADGSTIGMAPVGLSSGPVAQAGPSGRSAAVRWLLGLVCLVALGFGAWGTWHLMVGRFGRQGDPNATGAAGLIQRFAGSPETYGVLAPGEVCRRDDANEPAPAFSWVGKVDPAGARFVASKRGRHYYPITDPAAVLIREEDFVGYKTADEARADGRVPAR